ncbi:rhodanese-like domain-containing protein [Desulfonatronovibrio magnus]|uniref:rhodanese-like domain-containing protein n=1 Tax=Desulfonatronovibrio magnus TaxID=698827 RepID=UPI0005EBB797|nr:rhodanese-like domain-containing protein [Desulfonatronovibrio magnus]
MNEQQIIDLSAQEFKDFTGKQKEDSFNLVDVRTPQEYAHFHIPGAVLVPLYELEGRLGEIAADKNTVFYCRSGKRSMSASILARDSGLLHQDIYNLAGGILAYQGKTLANYPKINLFSRLTNQKLVLQKAIDLEKGAQNFYSILADSIQDQELQNKISKLAKLEKGHAKMVYSLNAQAFDDDFEMVFAKAGGDIMEGGSEISAWIDELKNVDEPGLHSYLLEMALEVETMAYDMYRNLAQKSNSQELSECFFKLAEQEKAHMRIVSSMFKDLNI